MNKILYFIFFIVVSIKMSAQADTEHWFAPIYDTYINPKPSYDNSLNGDFLYLSTDFPDDFTVEIYNGDNLLERAMIRKDTPKYIKIPTNIITTINPSDTFHVGKKGLHITGAQKFYAGLRILRGPDAEIITSKGRAALGTDFLVFMAAHGIQNESFTSQVNIIATENNTTVKIKGYNPDVVFLNHPQASELTVKLNKGESYMAVLPYRMPDRTTGFPGDPYENSAGLAGASVQADKSVSITNGSFNSTYINPVLSMDILMDQAVPVNRLGKEYIIAKGNGRLDVPGGGGADMERVIVLATKNNTKIKINDSPITYSLNRGDIKILYASSFYKKQAAGIYNMYVNSTEDIYVYQLFASSDGITDYFGSGSMSLVPAINCTLPDQAINLAPPNQIGIKDNFDATLNIIAKKGAQISVDGVSLSGSDGPYPISGNTDWVHYIKKGIKGKINVTSTAAFIGSFVAGIGEIGYGGFFSGFNSVPQITKSGNCNNGIRLQIDNYYDTYEWYLDNKLIASGKNFYFINPEDYGSGNYYCKVSKKSCGDFITSVYPYTQCPVIVSSAISSGNCKPAEPILIQFSGDPLKPVNFDSVIITKQPEEGIVSKPFIENGKIFITYDPQNTNLSQVTFKYYFEGFGVFPASQEVTVIVNIAHIKLQNQDAAECIGFDHQGIYNLRDIFEVPANEHTTYLLYEYFKDKALSDKIPEIDLTNEYNQVESYKSEPGKTVYVKVTNQFGCNNGSFPAEILLKGIDLPVIDVIDLHGNASVFISASLGRPPYSYYIKKNGPLDYLPPSEYFTGNPLPIKEGKGLYTVYVKSADDCNPVVQTFEVIGVSNVITPNDDGKNDVIDMSGLTRKINPGFQIFDRNGKKVFEGSVSNQFIWDGRLNGNVLPTGTYWYSLQWQDFEGAESDILTGWIFLKNRDSD